MSQPVPHAHDHSHDHGHSHGHDHAHHEHDHGPEAAPHAVAALPSISLLRMSLGQRIGWAGLVIAAIWAGVFWAMR